MTRQFLFSMARTVPASALRTTCLIGAGIVATTLSGCMPSSGDGGASQELTGAILSPISNIVLSGNQSLTIVYAASPSASRVDCFYVPVESTDVNAPAIGAEVVFAMDLPTSTTDQVQRTVSLETGSIAAGLYRVGLNLQGQGSQSLKVLSQGTFRISQLPIPVFSQPNRNLALVPGTEPVVIQALLGDPDNAVQWRIFYIREDLPCDASPIGTLGSTIATGLANVAETIWSTAGIDFGRYRIGISVTDSGQSVADTSVAGNDDQIITVCNDFIVELVAEPPPPMPPLVQVTQPAGDVTLFQGDAATVEFTVSIFQGPPSEQIVDVFYDFDGVANSGDEVIFSGDLPITATNASFTSSLISIGETVNIGVRADDGQNDPVTVYAPGQVTYGTPAAATLTVTQPARSLPVRPGEDVDVRWQLRGVPPTANATVEVYHTRLNTDERTQVLDPSPIATLSAKIDTTDLIGVFQVTVRVEFADGSAPLMADAPTPLTVTTLPKVVWVGDLIGKEPQFRGAIFDGANFEDNAGSSFAGGTDFNGDGAEDLIIVSRFGKPDFLNPSGVGIGEAYLLRGSAELEGKEFNLNSVSTPELPGMVFSGIPIINPTSSDQTYGIASVFISSDADGDGLGEIWFGSPFANYETISSVSRGFIERKGMFCHGGVVCVSSKNGRVNGNNANSDTNGGRILLGSVGMTFLDSSVHPEPPDTDLCINGSPWLADLYEWFEGDCPGSGTLPAIDGCLSIFSGLVEGDDMSDSLIQPQPGFSPVLANSFVQTWYNQTLRTPCEGTALTLGNPCPSCDFFGTGCNNSCVPYTFATKTWATGLSGYSTFEPINQFVTANAFCNIEFGIAGLFALPPVTPMMDCGVFHANNHLIGENPAAILQIDDGPTSSFMVSQYLDNVATGLARFPTFTGFYPDLVLNADNETETNDPIQPWGMRIVGRQPSTNVFTPDTCPAMTTPDHEELSLFGTSIAETGGSMIISAPQRDAIEDVDAIDFITPCELENSGVLYLFDNFPYWETDSFGDFGGFPHTPPKPHMFLAGGGGVTGFRGGPGASAPGGLGIPRWDLAVDREFEFVNTPPAIVGGAGERVQEVIGIGDFDGDFREDFAVGSPKRDTDDGAVYIVFRRAPSLEGDFILEKLALATDDPERLRGILVTGNSGAGEGFGRILAAGVDMNSDGVGDVLVGNPNGNGGKGEVAIIFSRTGVVSPLGGVSIDDLIADNQAARIVGIDADAEFGFTITNAGDVDGDGKDDLLIAAPSGSPMFDPDPTDDVDELVASGIDLNLDGEQDDVSGPFGMPDDIITGADDLIHAGLVYLILSSADATEWDNGSGEYEISIDQLGTLALPGVIFVGRNGERLAANGMGIEGDYMGGGDAADVTRGGIAQKDPITAVGGSRSQGRGLGKIGDIDNDGLDDFMLGSMLADPRVNARTGEGERNGGEAYLIYGFRP